jgi:hypothetical protein
MFASNHPFKPWSAKAALKVLFPRNNNIIPTNNYQFCDVAKGTIANVYMNYRCK